MKIYVLKEGSGQYEDYYESVVGIYSTYEKAKIKKDIKIKEDKDTKDKIDAQYEVLDKLQSEYWITRDKYLSEGLSIKKITKEYEEAEDKLDVWGGEYERYWYDIKGYELE
jgi:hypothetical protein